MKFVSQNETTYHTLINMHALCALPIVSSIGGKVVASPQRVYVEDSLSSSLFVFSHGIQVARAAVRGTGLLLTTVEMAG